MYFFAAAVLVCNVTSFMLQSHALAKTVMTSAIGRNVIALYPANLIG